MVKVPRNYMENDRTSTMLQSNVLSKPAVQVLSTRGNSFCCVCVGAAPWIYIYNIKPDIG
jgi:hypothetical protein